MQIIYSIILGLTLFLSHQAYANWQVDLQRNQTDATSTVTVTNDVERKEVMVYLAWVDLDVWKFFSWQFQQGWRSQLQPVFNTPTDLPSFDSYSIDFEDKHCPEQHRCFLAFVTTPKEINDPTNPDIWETASLLPLSLAASQQRLRGQTIFLAPDNQSVERVDESSVANFDGDITADTVAEAAPAEESALAAPTVSGNAPAETEKPDIFKLIGDKILYANGRAKRFQVIDISDLEHPKISDWVALEGSPRELYVLNNYYVLLQDTYTTELNQTQFTVLRQNDDGTLNEVPQTTANLTGHFLESRRRNDIIYTVTQDYIDTTTPENEDAEVEAVADIACFDCFIQQEIVLNINALRLSATGQLEPVGEAQVPGYSPNVAIFPDNLVIANHNPVERNWQSTQIQVFDLYRDEPLVALQPLTVPGQIPSEFHLSIHNQQLRVVYGPENREDGSTLAIYDLASQDMKLIGQVAKIAPGEALFATRFVDNRAFVVTFERTDPLWVIDLSKPEAPTILGELEIPGWSEKMFFHDDKLFAIGIHDQPLEGEDFQWTSRVAISLFDVKDPTNPSLIKRLVPFAGEARNSYSEALSDERALLLDWTDMFAALPIYSWETETRNHLQIISLANDTLTDAGRLNSTVQIQRSAQVADDALAALGDQALMTLRWGIGQEPQVLGELELATNISWLMPQKESLWAGAIGDGGYHRVYRYTTNDVETPAERWNLPTNYSGLETDGDWAVFHNSYNYAEPITVQVLDLNTKQLKPALELEKQLEPATTKESPINAVAFEEPAIAPALPGDSVASFAPYYPRTSPLVHDGWFYMAERRPIQADNVQTTLFTVPEKYYWQDQWVLRGWNLNDNGTEAPIRSIPGTPLLLTANGELITQENTPDGLRFNLLALTANSAHLLQSRDGVCSNYSTQVMKAGEALYITCQSNIDYGSEPVFFEEETFDSASSEQPEKEDNGESEQTPELTTELIKLAVIDQKLTDIGHWTLTGYHHLRAASGNIVVMMANNYSYGPYFSIDTVAIDVAEPAILRQVPSTELPKEQTGCNIYQLASEEPILLKHLETCEYGNQRWALSSDKAWIANNFAGIKTIDW